MRSVIWGELKKLFHNCNLYLCVLGMGIILPIAGIGQMIGNSRGTFIDRFTAVSSNEIILICFLFCIVGGVYQYCAEEKYGYAFFEIQRIGVQKYCVGKLIISVFGGFLTALLGQIVSCLHIILILGVQYTDKNSIFPTFEELEKFMWIIITFSLLCSMLSALGFVVTTFIPNFYIGITIPILMYYITLSLEQWIRIPENLQIIHVYYRVTALKQGYASWFLYSCMYTTCLLILFYLIAKHRIQRRLEHA